MRYDNTVQEENPQFIEKYDFILDNIIAVNIPEVDLDLYAPTMNISTADYALQQTEKFCSDTQQEMAGVNKVMDDSSKAGFSTSDGGNYSNVSPDEN